MIIAMSETASLAFAALVALGGPVGVGRNIRRWRLKESSVRLPPPPIELLPAVAAGSNAAVRLRRDPKGIPLRPAACARPANVSGARAMKLAVRQARKMRGQPHQLPAGWRTVR